MANENGRTAGKNKDYMAQCYIDASVYEKWISFLESKGIQRTGKYSKMKDINSDLLSIAIETILDADTQTQDDMLFKYK